MCSLWTQRTIVMQSRSARNSSYEKKRPVLYRYGCNSQKMLAIKMLILFVVLAYAVWTAGGQLSLRDQLFKRTLTAVDNTKKGRVLKKGKTSIGASVKSSLRIQNLSALWIALVRVQYEGIHHPGQTKSK